VKPVNPLQKDQNGGKRAGRKPSTLD